MLTVIMDFSRFPSITEYLRKRLRTVYREINAGVEDLSYLEDRQDCMGYHALMEASWGGPVELMASNIARCQSLTMIFRPEIADRQCNWFWSMFEYSAPNLVELVTVNAHPERLLQDTKWLPAAPLKKLVLQSWPASHQIIATDCKPLHSLEVPLDKPQDLRTLTQFTLLPNLTLTFKTYDISDLMELGSEKLTFSAVTSLALRGPVQAEIGRILKFPSVRDFDITRSEEEPFYLPLEVSPISVTWIVGETKTKASMEIRVIFEKYTRMRAMVMRGRYMKVALKHLEDVREGSGGMKDLRRIDFLGCRTTISASGLGSIKWGMERNPTVDTSIKMAREELLSNLLQVDLIDSDSSGSKDNDGMEY